MTIHYALVQNDALAGEGRLVARVYSAGTIDREEVVWRDARIGEPTSCQSTTRRRID